MTEDKSIEDKVKDFVDCIKNTYCVYQSETERTYCGDCVNCKYIGRLVEEKLE